MTLIDGGGSCSSLSPLIFDDGVPSLSSEYAPGLGENPRKEQSDPKRDEYQGQCEPAERSKHATRLIIVRCEDQPVWPLAPSGPLVPGVCRSDAPGRSSHVGAACKDGGRPGRARGGAADRAGCRRYRSPPEKIVNVRILVGTAGRWAPDDEESAGPCSCGRSGRCQLRPRRGFKDQRARQPVFFDGASALQNIFRGTSR
jgi:hypothetical protein